MQGTPLPPPVRFARPGGPGAVRAQARRVVARDARAYPTYQEAQQSAKLAARRYRRRKGYGSPRAAGVETPAAADFGRRRRPLAGTPPRLRIIAATPRPGSWIVRGDDDSRGDAAGAESRTRAARAAREARSRQIDSAAGWDVGRVPSRGGGRESLATPGTSRLRPRRTRSRASGASRRCAGRGPRPSPRPRRR